MGASMRYLSQRYAMPYKEVAGLLTDIGTEELAHLGEGGLCLGCKVCTYPNCGFGKGW